LVSLLLAGIPCSAQKSSQPRAIDVRRSSLTIHVFKTGLFSAFGHDHQISAPIEQGHFTEGPNPSVELLVNSGKLKVLDQDVSEKDRAEIQQTMLGPKVL